jgi:hypothetical protein
MTQPKTTMASPFSAKILFFTGYALETSTDFSSLLKQSMRAVEGLPRAA